jgi:prolipoprotein diacylglyceryltransferase
VTPIITKHYGLGLLVGIGFGLFLANILIDSGVITDNGSRRLMGGVGLVGMIIGGILYGMSLRKPPANG